MYLESVRKHLRHGHCLGGAGWAESTWNQWLTDAKADPTGKWGKEFYAFLAEIEAVKREAAGQIIGLIETAADDGDLKAKTFLAERVHKYERTQHIETKVEATVTHEDATQKLMDRLDRIATRFNAEGDT